MHGHKTIGQMIQHNTGLETTNVNAAMNAIFPQSFYTYGQDLTDGMKEGGLNTQIEDLVAKFAGPRKSESKPKSQSNAKRSKQGVVALREEELRVQKELQKAKQDIDAIN